MPRFAWKRTLIAFAIAAATGLHLFSIWGRNWGSDFSGLPKALMAAALVCVGFAASVGLLFGRAWIGIAAVAVLWWLVFGGL